MRYVEARLDEYQREEAYRFYLGKSLQLIPQNKWLKNDYFYFVNLEKKPRESRSGDQIAADIMKRAGLHFEE